VGECPICGTEVATSLKTWFMVGRPSKTGERFKLTLGWFKCPICERGFRAIIKKEKATIEGTVEEIRGIEKGLVQTLRSLRGKIEKLEIKKAEFLAEIEKLKKTGEERANVLEKEIVTLRAEVESLKNVLGDPEKPSHLD
jgi:DNA repair exonuclease SbcCD ATPase subunit